MKEVTDPGLLAQLNGGGGKEVSDPSVLSQLNAEPHKPGGLESFVRGAANGATFNLADTLAAAGDATIPLDNGSSSAPSWSQRYQENMAKQRGETGAAQSTHPLLSLGGTVAGGFLNPVSRAIAPAKTVLGAVGQGAALGAGYGAGGAISNQDDLKSGAINTGVGALTGGALGAASHGLKLLLQPRAITPAAQSLQAEGVNPTIGQMMGGTAQRLEDSHTSIPIYGDAIKDAQRGGIEDFNRAAYNRVLAPLGLKYGADAPVGNQGIQHLDNLIGKAYDHAFDGAKVDATSPTFTEGGSKLLEDAASVLTPDRLKMVQNNINIRVNSKLDQDGILGGDDLVRAKNWFAEQSRAGPNATQDEQAQAAVYKNVLGLLKQGIMETDPDRAALLKAADKSFAQFIRVSQAASSNNASGKEGIFTPAQLGTAARQLDNSVRKGSFAKGSAPMQDLAQAGQQTLSQTVPDSGTAIRSIFEHPLSAIATAPAWLAGRALYSKPGQAIAKKVLFGGSPTARMAISQTPLLLQPGELSLVGHDATRSGP